MDTFIKAELISIGNELLNGITPNTNASWLGETLAKIGPQVNWITVIRDVPAEIEAALQTASKRADLIIATGGLGPTPDDLTRQAIGSFFETELILHPEILEKIEKIFAGRNMEMPEINRVQALVPRTAVLIENSMGTAPGFEMVKEGKVFYFLPGVPLEMKRMMEQTILGKLKERFVFRPVPEHLFRTTGIAESRVYEKIADILNRYPEFPAAFLPKTSGIDIRLKNYIFQPEAESKFTKCIAEIRSCLDKYIFSETEESLPEVIGRLLTGKKLSLALAESFSGGLVADWITNIPGSSSYFAGSVVTYSNKSKIDLLKVSAQSIEQNGAVSPEVALEMVHGVRQLFHTECALSTTGIAGPGGATCTKPLGLCFLAAVCPDDVRVRQFNFGRDRRTNKQRGAAAALELLRRMLLHIE
jgi:nicotinamide-nucleotide amidase